MKVTLQTENPKDIVFTLAISMTLGNWMKLRDQLREVNGTPSPSWDVSIRIRNLVEQAQKVYLPEIDNDVP